MKTNIIVFFFSFFFTSSAHSVAQPASRVSLNQGDTGIEDIASKRRAAIEIYRIARRVDRFRFRSQENENLIRKVLAAGHPNMDDRESFPLRERQKLFRLLRQATSDKTLNNDCDPVPSDFYQQIIRSEDLRRSVNRYLHFLDQIVHLCVDLRDLCLYRFDSDESDSRFAWLIDRHLMLLDYSMDINGQLGVKLDLEPSLQEEMDRLVGILFVDVDIFRANENEEMAEKTMQTIHRILDSGVFEIEPVD